MPALPPVKKFVSNTGVRVYRIACQVFETLSARVYLLLGAGPPTLVDAGSGLGPSTSQILAGIENVRSQFGEPVRPSDIRRIILSHRHADHIGGLTDLLKTTRAEVAVHALDRMAVVSHQEYVMLGNRRLGEFFDRAGVNPGRRAALLRMSHYSGTMGGGSEGPSQHPPVAQPRAALPPSGFNATLTLTDGQELDGLRVIHTPGHSPGHVCIAVGNILLSADHILARTVPQQWPESVAAYTGLGHYLESLEKIERMPGFELALAAHEQPIHDLYARIKTIRGAHQRRLDRLLAMLSETADALSIDEITRQLYPEVSGFRAMLAITDVGSRVEYLHQRGRLKVANLDEVANSQNGVCRYAVA
jgi:glyoxylase-like metal-dependent hydrolase (beta-lactamase superfamily II)